MGLNRVSGIKSVKMLHSLTPLINQLPDTLLAGQIWVIYYKITKYNCTFFEFHLTFLIKGEARILVC